MKQQSNWWLFRPLALVLALAMALTCLAAPALAASIPQRANAQARKADQTRNINFDNNWYFRQTDARTPAKPVRVTLPHDAMIHGSRSAGSPGSSGVAYFDPGIVYQDIQRSCGLEGQACTLAFRRSLQRRYGLSEWKESCISRIRLYPVFG